MDIWQVFEGGHPVKAQPLAFWSFADCFAYLDKYGLERHPLHEQVGVIICIAVLIGEQNLYADLQCKACLRYVAIP